MPRVPAIRLLGDPVLRERCAEVRSFDAALQDVARVLIATLAHFRKTHGFGRAISAPQIGVPLRLIAVELGAGPFVVVNPVVTRRSRSTFTMWDDCMSFPDLLVRLRRARSISLRYSDAAGASHDWEELPLPAAELMQHEIDHLDGTLAIDRAIDRDSIVLRSVFDAGRAHFEANVDYVIQPALAARDKKKGAPWARLAGRGSVVTRSGTARRPRSSAD